MSGFVCPECHGTYFVPKGNDLQCELCGWVGENDGSRAWLTEEGYNENARRHALMKAGKLFIIRIHLKGPDDERSNDVSSAMDILGINGMGGSDGKGETNYKAELDKRPTDETIAKLKKLKTMKDVSIWP